MFLNIQPSVTNWTPDGKEFSLIFDDNPLAEFVELDGTVTNGAAKTDGSAASSGLFYSNILCGVIRGALEMVLMQVSTTDSLLAYPLVQG